MHYFLQANAENAAMHQQTRAIILKLMADQGIGSERQLAIDCGMSQSTLNRFMSGKTETLEFLHLHNIAQHLNVTVSQLIGETPLTHDPKIKAVTLAMASMPEYQKDMLVAASSSLSQQSPPKTLGALS